MPILIRRTGQNYYSDTEEVMPIEIIRKDREEMEDTKLKNMEESKIERPETVENDLTEGIEFECNIPGLTQKQLKRLRVCYEQIDEDGSDSINRAEFVTWVGQEHAEKFIHRCFASLDTNNDSDISFEFVVQVFKICTLDRDHLISFAFDLYDADKSELIDRGELEDMFDEMYGEESFKVYSLIDVIDRDGNGIVTFSEFRDSVRKHSQMLRPAFAFQRALQTKTLGGAKQWNDLGKRHIKLRRQEEEQEKKTVML